MWRRTQSRGREVANHSSSYNTEGSSVRAEAAETNSNEKWDNRGNRRFHSVHQTRAAGGWHSSNNTNGGGGGYYPAPVPSAYGPQPVRSGPGQQGFTPPVPEHRHPILIRYMKPFLEKWGRVNFAQLMQVGERSMEQLPAIRRYTLRNGRNNI